jgi:acyl-CoA dehydrogenase
MEFSTSEKVMELTKEVREFMQTQVLPNEERYYREIAESGNPHHQPQVMEELKAKTRAAGLWNLFLPQVEWGGSGLSNQEFAPLFEEMGRSLIGPEAFNCHPPESGNMGLLADWGSPEQQQQWLVPLLNATMSSCFSMTEPDVASSDATNITARIVRDGDDYVLNGRKAPSTGAAKENCKLAIVVGVTDPAADVFRQQSLLLVPLDTPGVNVVRTWKVFGYDQQVSQAEIIFTDVRVPVTNLIQGEGDGFRVSQARLGPGRIHHCIRVLGMAERALELMCHRVASRETFGTRLADQGVIQDWIARSRVEIEQARLLTLKTAWLMDEMGNKAARQQIAAIKLVAPTVALNVIDRAIQAHGAAGVSQHTPLAEFWSWARTLRILDGPDEVHVRSLARWELTEQLSS